MMSTAREAIEGGSAEHTAPELWERICSCLQTHRRMFIFADFDGTLSETVDVPSKAALDRETYHGLRRLSANKRVSVAILSGRSVDDLSARVGLPLIYAGDHGIEIHAPHCDFIHPEAAQLRKRLPEIANRVRHATQRMPGVLVEMKRFGASVHYRQARSGDVVQLRDVVESCLDQEPFEIQDGTCVFEVTPRLKWHKGEAVAWVLSQMAAQPTQAICIGDDHTDEQMFARVPGAITVRVTSEDCRHPTMAAYHLPRTSVSSLLWGIADIAEGYGCYAP